MGKRYFSHGRGEQEELSCRCKMTFPLYHLLQINKNWFVSLVLLYQCESKKSLKEKDGGERRESWECT